MIEMKVATTVPYIKLFGTEINIFKVDVPKDGGRGWVVCSGCCGAWRGKYVGAKKVKCFFHT